MTQSFSLFSTFKPVRFMPVIAISCIALLIGGCSHFQAGETGRCAYIKRQQLFHRYDHSISADWVTDGQKQALKDQYEEYGCGAPAKSKSAKETG
ncbi:MAG: hypothetical protein Tsb005_12540 [Gammaproteobacteria bacterium]